MSIAGQYRPRRLPDDSSRSERRDGLPGLLDGLAEFGFGWADTTATQVYTVHNLYPFLADDIVRRGGARAGLTWHYARPPVQGLEYEMDCRSVGRDRVV